MKSWEAPSHWYLDKRAWRFVLRYLLFFGPLNLLWEIAQLPLYTLWYEAPVSYMAYAVLHCTLGDLLIGVLTLLSALIILRAGPTERWHWSSIALCTIGLGVAYTAFSEWVNTSVRLSWAYSEWMPLTPLLGLGVSPLLQWLLLPTIALMLARRDSSRTG
ncbi:hypothetical protein [Stutzerimonas stutzeri]|uniref:hypothetical protein n=1 Tax=Stutzerimonas stutzeri TaxID=316 RepID=UPI00210A2540|nr:hypothetical protein [Stutzerimonas stutzeri]MCQ4321142.1 hypothetical protein [Stutzerimonas stutzeri]